MPSNLSKLQLINKLLSYQSLKLKISKKDFSQSLTKPLALEINALSSLYDLEILYLNTLKNLEPLASLELENLPAEIALAGYEYYLKDDLKNLSALLDAQISISSYLTEFKAGDYAFKISFYYLKEENKIPFNLYFKDKDSLDTLLNHLLSLNLPTLSNLPQNKLKVCLHFVIGEITLSLKELKSLHEGDGLALECFYLNEDKLFLDVQGKRALCEIKQSQVLLKSAFENETKLQEVSAMSEQESNQTGDVLNSLDELKFKVKFELESRDFSLEELKALQVESTIPLLNHDLSKVSLMVGEQCVGKGRIIDIGDRYALQITELFKNEQ